MTSRIATHGPECWRWHPDCAAAEIDRLTLLLRFLEWNCGDGGRFDVWEDER